MKKRFSSEMFLAYLPPWLPESEAEEIVKYGDGGKEVTEAKFYSIPELLQKSRDKEVVFFPPQFYTVSRLAEVLKDCEGDGVEEVARLADEIGGYKMKPRMIKKLEGRTMVMGLGEEGDVERVVVLELAEKGEPRGVVMVSKEEIWDVEERNGKSSEGGGGKREGKSRL